MIDNEGMDRLDEEAIRRGMKRIICIGSSPDTYSGDSIDGTPGLSLLILGGPITRHESEARMLQCKYTCHDSQLSQPQ